MPYSSRTPDFAHQSEARRRARLRPAFALLMEMGTGKTKIIVDEIGDLFTHAEIDGALIFCPNGLQRNWCNEFATHCGIETRIAIVDGHMTKKKRDAFEALLKPGAEHRVVIANIESVRSKASRELLARFLASTKSLYMAIDESQRIKNPKAEQTKKIIELSTRAKYRRIASGTATPNSPVDLFSQFLFLDPRILGFTSLAAFKAHHCVLLSPYDPMLIGLARKIGRNPLYMQIEARDEDGKPRYRHLDQLAEKIAPHAMRVRKEECLDLPPKLYERITIELAPKQRSIYNAVRSSVLAEFVHDGKLMAIASPLMIARLARLAQINGNHFADEDGGGQVRIMPTEIKKDQVVTQNPRLAAMLDILEDAEGQPVIIWARYTAEINEIMLALGKDARRLDGSVKANDRQDAITDFQEGRARFLVGQISLGIGFNATAAKLMIYYSNDFSLANRLQSEDRAHRKGLAHPLTIFDIEALDTIDGKIIDALRSKRELSEIIAGDPISNWI